MVTIRVQCHPVPSIMWLWCHNTTFLKSCVVDWIGKRLAAVCHRTLHQQREVRDGLGTEHWAEFSFFWWMSWTTLACRVCKLCSGVCVVLGVCSVLFTWLPVKIVKVYTTEVMAYSVVQRGSPNTLEYRVYFGKDSDKFRLMTDIELNLFSHVSYHHSLQRMFL